MNAQGEVADAPQWQEGMKDLGGGRPQYPRKQVLKERWESIENVFFYLVGWDLTPIRSLCRSPRFV
jgi:hypothetical protein